MFQRVLRILAGVAVSIIIILLITAGIVAWKVKRYASAWATTTHTSFSSVVSEAARGWKSTPITMNGWKTILVLGLDEIPGRPEGEGSLTDTLILVSANINTGKVVTISLPRDLWVDAYKTKINALYVYGRQRNADQPEAFPRDVIQEVTGLQIQHIVPVHLSTVAEVVDAMGGVDIDIERSFEDKKFPREGVDVAKERNPNVLYETISFAKGVEHMSGNRVLQYIRSRQSTDEVEGTDEGRVVRQQRALRVIASAVFSPDTLRNPTKTGALYLVYQNAFARMLPVSEIVATAHALLSRMASVQANESPFTFISRSLSIKDEKNVGVIVHPPTARYSGQWVYIPVDPTWKGVQEEVRRFHEE